MMKSSFSLLFVLGCFGHALDAASKPAPIDFSRDVRPILSKHCFACHGPDDGHRLSGFRLDQHTSVTKPRGARPAVIVPGAPEKSLFILRITATDDATRMPPKETGERLTPSQIATLRAWVKQGAAYTEHWAFVKPRQAALPKVKDEAWCRSPIDYFILAKLEAAALKPNPEADRYTLLRRASLDLRGLPPTPEEVGEFERDSRPDAYERRVDRFLNDPAYGERWARMWLDLARYADSAGYGSDPLRMNIWPWRDWVIQSFNRNLSYDQFTIEQLAGDLLPNATLEQKIATAFHRNTMTNTEGGTDDEEFRVAAVKDRIETTMQVWMGLTFRCAQCHSHKYDPITNREYYSFFSFFNQTADTDKPDEQPTLAIPEAGIEAKIREAEAKINKLKRQLADGESEVKAGKAKPESVQPVKDEIAKLEKSKPSPTVLPVMVELPPDKQRLTRIMVKGNFLMTGDKVDPCAPTAFNGFPKNAQLNRLGVAHWLLSPDNPLTARVAVNRFWAQLFGVGIVETEEDFGTQGEWPTHPELLDWLAMNFMNGRMEERKGGRMDARSTTLPFFHPSNAWDVKALLKLIVTSSSYRQSSRVTPDRLRNDPRNRLLSRAPRIRLEAEMVRDQALALGGLLGKRIGGPSVYPPQPPGLWQAAFNGQRTYPTSTGEDRYRRGLYTFWRRTVPYPSMATFDAPSRETCSMRRSRTNTPLQALVTLNDPVYVEFAQSFARRIVREGGASAEDRARFALRVCLCRPPQAAQVRQLVALFSSERDHYAKNPEAAKQLVADLPGPVPPGMEAAELAAWTVVANVLLNLDAVMMKG